MVLGHRTTDGLCVTGQQGLHAAVDQRADGVHGFVNAGVFCSTSSDTRDHVGGWSVDARVPNDEAQAFFETQTIKPMEFPCPERVAHGHGAAHYGVDRG